MSKAYPSNLTRSQYEFLKDMIPEAKPGGRKREVDMWELRRQKAEGRGQKKIPINKFRGFDKDTFFLALARLEKNLSTFFINKFRGL